MATKRKKPLAGKSARKAKQHVADALEVKVPNLTTQEAIAELEAGKGKEFESIKTLMDDLNADD